tara:strand:+ start:178 stop:690 length:513 start_codon:yes stop_codon:yes gene_type:complete
MTDLISSFEILPDDIKDLVYSKIVYKQQDNLLEEIKKYGLIRSWLHYLNFIENEDLNYIIIDLAIIKLAIEEFIDPTSVNPTQLSAYSLELLDQYYVIIDDINIKKYNNMWYREDKIKKELIFLIKHLMMKIDVYYIEKVINHLISDVISKELDMLEEFTYNGIFYNEFE